MHSHRLPHLHSRDVVTERPYRLDSLGVDGVNIWYTYRVRFEASLSVAATARFFHFLDVRFVEVCDSIKLLRLSKGYRTLRRNRTLRISPAFVNVNKVRCEIESISLASFELNSNFSTDVFVTNMPPKKPLNSQAPE
ncbi:MAG: hypothetical protein WCK15_25180 [Pirellula sp.]